MEGRQPDELVKLFDKTCVEAMSALYERMSFGLWMVTRADGEDWIVLKSRDRDYGVQDGDAFVWMETFCSRMVEGQGPNFAPESNKILVYAQAEIGRKIKIEAYMGFPLRKPDGELIGTLCAINPTTVPESWAEHEEFVAAMARDLEQAYLCEFTETSINAQSHELTAEQEDHMKILLELDWESLVEFLDDQAKSKEFSDAIILLNIDAGSRSEQAMAKILRSCIGPSNFLIYRGHCRYGIILVDCSYPQLDAYVCAVQSALHELRVKHHMGYALQTRFENLSTTCDRALGQVIRKELQNRAA